MLGGTDWDASRDTGPRLTAVTGTSISENGVPKRYTVEGDCVALRKSGDIASARSMRYGEKALALAERAGGAGRGGGIASLGSPRRPVSGPDTLGNIS